jgi:hypothetical protein
MFCTRPHPHLYEINTWLWLEELSSHAGKRITLGTVPDQEWDLLKDLGFDLVWLMGIWKRSAVGRRIARTQPSLFSAYDEALPGWTLRDIAGSPYSIQEYVPDSHLGSWEELDALRTKLHARGMGLILDFVPNHTGFDHAWTQSHPEYYVTGALQDFRENPEAFYLVEREGNGPAEAVLLARGRDPYFPPWMDVAQLNYFEPGARRALIGELRHIAQHCDGVRCDMSMLELNEVFSRTWGWLLRGKSPPQEEFWADALAAVPDFIWIAEVYWGLEGRMQELGFNFTYDKGLYDRLRASSAREIRLHLAADAGYQQRMVRFLENHDEARAAAAFPGEKLRAAAVLVATLPGMRFYHHGQLEGRRIRIPVQLGRAPAEASDPDACSFYETVLHLSGEEIFHQGEWRLIEPAWAGDATYDSLIAYAWRHRDAARLIAVNLSPCDAQGRLHLGDLAESGHTYVFRDELHGVDYLRQGRELTEQGLYVRLAPYGCHWFSILPQN